MGSTPFLLVSVDLGFFISGELVPVILQEVDDLRVVRSRAFNLAQAGVVAERNRHVNSGGPTGGTPESAVVLSLTNASSEFRTIIENLLVLGKYNSICRNSSKSFQGQSRGILSLLTLKTIS